MLIYSVSRIQKNHFIKKSSLPNIWHSFARKTSHRETLASSHHAHQPVMASRKLTLATTEALAEPPGVSSRRPLVEVKLRRLH